jgi:hypothetical protein
MKVSRLRLKGFGAASSIARCASTGCQEKKKPETPRFGVRNLENQPVYGRDLLLQTI